MSTRITQSMVQRSLLADLNSVADRLSRTRIKLSSGKEITRPSDDPFAVSRAITLRSSLEETRQYQRNVNEATAWADTTEVALARITDAVQRARELLIQGSSDTNGPEARAAIAAEIETLIDLIKQEANTTYAGRYVFAGTATETRPYDLGPSDAYNGNTDAVVREIGPGVAVRVNVVGSDLLGQGQAAGDDKLLHVLRDIVDHLRGGTPAVAAPTTRASGFRPYFSSAASEATSSAAAPSFTPEALPAVTVPPLRKGVGSFASFSSVVSRGCSSFATTIGSPLR